MLLSIPPLISGSNFIIGDCKYILHRSVDTSGNLFAEHFVETVTQCNIVTLQERSILHIVIGHIIITHTLEVIRQHHFRTVIQSIK